MSRSTDVITRSGRAVGREFLGELDESAFPEQDPAPGPCTATGASAHEAACQMRITRPLEE
ncbi:hypothetical protein [Streptomyces sp. NPDC053079]|uniref:hypothetical protein n=1 Tax=Streptomyces sp. NPDC053079 TaxID=3365697 RepID=UPI0037D7E8FE